MKPYVLIADDDPIITDLLVSVMLRTGHFAEVVANGGAVLRRPDDVLRARDLGAADYVLKSHA